MSVQRKILIVDDDDDLRDALAEQLMLVDEFDVYEASTGAQGIERAKTEMHDLVILDVALEDMDGREVCRQMRRQGVKCPVVMLTGQTSDADQILGL
ncbi:MAG: response regulator, partial [Pseudomonadota bacterium]